MTFSCQNSGKCVDINHIYMSNQSHLGFLVKLKLTTHNVTWDFQSGFRVWGLWSGGWGVGVWFVGCMCAHLFLIFSLKSLRCFISNNLVLSVHLRGLLLLKGWSYKLVLVYSWCRLELFLRQMTHGSKLEDGKNQPILWRSTKL